MCRIPAHLEEPDIEYWHSGVRSYFCRDVS